MSEVNTRVNSGSSASHGSAGLAQPDGFARRHLGSDEAATQRMLEFLGFDSMEAMVKAAVPLCIRLAHPLRLPPALSEFEALSQLRQIAGRNRVLRSFIGMGYYDCITPPVIQRNVLENPGWYTQYTPYQAEIAQGRLEALLNFQTMIADLTGLEVANASLLDEGTAAAEAMAMCLALCGRNDARVFFVSERCFPQTIDVLKTRAKPLSLEIRVGDHRQFVCDASVFGMLLQYPAADGAIFDYRPFVEQAHAAGAKVVVAADLLSLVLLRPRGRWGTASASVSPWVLEVRMPPISQPAMHLSARCRAGSSGFPAMPRASPLIGYPCKHGSSTSAGKKPPATSARPRPCWLFWRPCMPSIMARRG
jgi:glycine dehydrogenase